MSASYRVVLRDTAVKTPIAQHRDIGMHITYAMIYAILPFTGLLTSGDA
jgi:hypothetical protein